MIVALHPDRQQAGAALLDQQPLARLREAALQRGLGAATDQRVKRIEIALRQS